MDFVQAVVLIILIFVGCLSSVWAGYKMALMGKHIDRQESQKEQREQIDINTAKLKAIGNK